jgi:hypothetical protein
VARAASGHLSAAQRLIDSLPEDLLSVNTRNIDDASSDDMILVREFEDHVAFLDCVRIHTRWAEIWARHPASYVSQQFIIATVYP